MKRGNIPSNRFDKHRTEYRFSVDKTQDSSRGLTMHFYCCILEIMLNLFHIIACLPMTSQIGTKFVIQGYHKKRPIIVYYCQLFFGGRGFFKSDLRKALGMCTFVVQPFRLRSPSGLLARSPAPAFCSASPMHPLMGAYPPPS